MKTGFSFDPPHLSDKPYTVSEINCGISHIIEQGNNLVWVEAELTGFKQASSGHCYLRLKDENSQIPAVIWKQTALTFKFPIHDGLSVLAIASIRVYEKGGYYQLDIHKMQPAGIGALHAAFLALKEKLEKEGLFDEARKKPLPETINTLGVITSKHGAALFDIIKVVRSRSPRTNIVVLDVPVQGDAAPPKIVRAINDMNRHNAVDCIILGRGGGSVEDLWAFNDENVARAIAASPIPIISAVGHEIDFTIADFVADLRAPTPSAAAEIAVPDDMENKRYFIALSSRLQSSFSRFYEDAQMSYDTIANRTAWQYPLIMLKNAREQQTDVKKRMIRAIEQIITKNKVAIKNAASRLQALSPLGTMARGFSVVSHNGKTIKNALELMCKDQITIYFHTGKASALVTETQEKSVLLQE